MTQVLPKGWEEKNLDTLCEINIGKTPLRADSSYWDKNKETNNIWLSISDLQNTTNKQVYSSKEFLSDKGAKIVPLIDVGTLLLSFKLTIGRVAFAGVPLRTNEAIAQLPIRNNNVIDKYYLYYYLQSYDYEKLLKGDVKVKGKSLNKAKLKQLDVKFPSLPEQKRIVEKLDKIFADIDKAKEQTTQNLKNAQEVFESSLDAVLTKEAAKWPEKKLNDVCIVERGSSPRPIKSFITTAPDGVNWIKIGDCSGKYVTSTSQKITPEGAKKSRYVRRGDFIISNSMSYGKPYIMDLDGYIHDGWFVLRLNHSILVADFLYYILSSPFAKRQYDTLAAGAIVQNISSDLIKKVQFNLPPLAEQKRLVARLDDLQTKIQELEKIYTQKLADLDELKQSVLQQAFSGKL